MNFPFRKPNDRYHSLAPYLVERQAAETAKISKDDTQSAAVTAHPESDVAPTPCINGSFKSFESFPSFFPTLKTKDGHRTRQALRIHTK